MNRVYCLQSINITSNPSSFKESNYVQDTFPTLSKLCNFIGLLCWIIISTNEVWICLLHFLHFIRISNFVLSRKLRLFRLFFFGVLSCCCRRYEIITSQTPYENEPCISRKLSNNKALSLLTPTVCIVLLCTFYLKLIIDQNS